MRLGVFITDIWGEPLYRVTQFGKTEVEIPINDSRIARMNVSIYDPACAYVRPLDRLLKIFWGPFLVFWGPLLKPIWRGKDGTVQLNAHDPTIRLKHHYHRYGDAAVDYGVPVDGYGMRILLESTIPIDPQLTRGIVPNGIWWGDDDSSHQGPRPDTVPAEAGDGVWIFCQRGENVWDSVKKLSEVGATTSTPGGPDFEFVPTEGLDPGYTVVLNTDDKLERDKRDNVIFEYGYGKNNCEDFIHEPDGDAVRNYWVQVYPGGERGRDDNQRKGLYHNEASWYQYGIMQGWESSGQKDTKEALEAKARAWVQAYSYPPDYFTVVPKTDDPTGQTPRYLQDFRVGDRITARARKGYLMQDLTGRIVSAKLRQKDASSNTVNSLDCVPDVASPYDPDTEPG